MRPPQDVVAEALTEPAGSGTDAHEPGERAHQHAGHQERAAAARCQAFVSMTNNATAGQVNSLPVPLTDSDGPSVYVNGVSGTYLRTPASVNQFFLGGYGTVLSQLLRRNFPNYSAGIPAYRCRCGTASAQADLVTDQLNYRQSEIQDRQQLNNIKLNVLNAATVAAAGARGVRHQRAGAQAAGADVYRPAPEVRTGFAGHDDGGDRAARPVIAWSLPRSTRSANTFTRGRTCSSSRRRS